MSGGLGWPSGGYNSGGYGYNYYGYGFGYSAFGFGSFGWGPLFFGNGFFCDPLGLWICYVPAGYFPGSSFYLFPTLAYMAPFGTFPYSFSSYYPGSLFYNSPFSPVYSGGYCPLCSSTVYDPSALGLNTGKSYLTPLESSVLISNGVMPGLQSASSMAAAVSAGDSAAASDSSAPGETAASNADAGTSNAPAVSAMQNPRPGEPLTLVFTDGATVQATEYWLGDDGLVHYVTLAGVKFTVPLVQLDFTKTADANNQKGIQLLPPPAPQPRPSPSAQPPAPPQPH